MTVNRRLCRRRLPAPMLRLAISCAAIAPVALDIAKVCAADVPYASTARYESAPAEPRSLGDMRATPVSHANVTSDERTVGVTLDELEMDVAALAAGKSAAKSLAVIESDARDAWRRATTASDRNRAEIVIRRAGRLARGARPALLGAAATQTVYPEALAGPATDVVAGLAQTPLGGGFVSLAQYLAPTVTGPALPTIPPPAGPGYFGMPYPYAPPPARHYVSLDALGWWVKSDHLPALVTTSPLGTPQIFAGVIGQPGTSVLFGDQTVNGGIRPGGRIQGGVWLDDNAEFAIEGHYYALATETTTYSAASTFSTGTPTGPILARPFFNDSPLVNQQSAVLVAFPHFFVFPVFVNVDGKIQVKESSNIQSAGGGGRLALNQYTSPVRLFLVGGYRYFNLNESLLISSISSPGVGPYPPGTQLYAFDNFTTRNFFNGGEVGLGAEGWLRRWWLGAETRLAMGNMNEILNINGQAIAQSGAFSAIAPGGLLAQPTNIGSFSQNRFALIPQVNVKLGYQVLPGLRLTVGYNFTYVTRVLRPGDQVDTTVNGTQIAGGTLVGPARPQVLFNDTGIWLQGVTAGFDLTF